MQEPRRTLRRWLWLAALLWVGCATQTDPPATHHTSNATVENAPAPAVVSPTGQPNPAGPLVTLMPAGRDAVSVRVEVAKTPAERQRGLMFRQQMDEDAGMIFLFEQPQQLAFWMHNTFIPLDMIFIRSDMTVLGVVENAEPQTDDSRQVPGVSQYVLETNAGFARKHGIAAGNLVKFEGIEGVGR